MNISEDASVEELLEQGIISKKDYMEYKNYKGYLNELNTGYAFVTFSYSDEAKLALTVGNGSMYVDGYLLRIDLKRDYIDHKDLDEKYVLNEMKRSSKIVDEL